MAMERMSFVNNGEVRLPPGFHFHPTDEELVLHYLRRKVFSFPLLASVISEVEVFKFDPWDLPGDSEEERYYFSTNEVKYKNGSRSNRATASGYWKATGMDKQVVTYRIRRLRLVVGMKKTLVFYKGKPSNGTRTDWVMHEYSLANVENLGAVTGLLPNNLTQEKWVLCRIFLKERSSKGINSSIYETSSSSKQENISESLKKHIQSTAKALIYDYIAMNNMVDPSSSSSSGSSGITEISCESEDQSSSCNSSSSIIPFERKSSP